MSNTAAFDRPHPFAAPATIAAAVILAVLCALACAPGLAVAGVTHQFSGREITEINGHEGTPELSEVNALTVNEGDLFVTEKGEGFSRTDEFDAGSLQLIDQFPQPSPSVSDLNEGVAVGHVEGQRQAFIGSRQGKVVVYSEKSPGEWQEAGEWTGTDTPQHSFEGHITGVAVDESKSATDWAKGDVIVVAGEQRTLDVFKPKINGGEEFVAQITGSTSEAFSTFGELRKIAIDQHNGDIALAELTAGAEGKIEVEVFEPEALNTYKKIATIAAKPDGSKFEGIGAVGFDDSAGLGADDLYVTDSSEGDVYEYSLGGVFRYALDGAATEAGGLRVTKGVAVDPATGNVFVGDQAKESSVTPSVIDEFGPFEIVPDVQTGAVGSAKFDSAAHTWDVVVDGAVNPEGVGPATCSFIWGAANTNENNSECEGPGSSQEALTGSTYTPVHSTLNGLLPGTRYVYRLTASNSYGLNSGTVGEDREIETAGPNLGEQWATKVTDTSADLSASVDPEENITKPNSTPTSVAFEYGPSAAYGSSTPATQLSPGSSFSDVRTVATELAAYTEYHYRAIVSAEIEPEPTSAPGATEIVKFYGPDHTFHTQIPAASTGAALPDARQWELVTPPDKHGGLVLGLNQVGFEGPVQASLDGSALTFGSEGPTEESPPGNGTFRIQVLAEHGGTDWSSHDISLPIEEKTGLEQLPDYLLFSEDLCQGVVPSLGSNAPILVQGIHEKLPYRWDRCECSLPAGKSCYEPLMTSTSEGGPVDASGEINILGATPDGNHIVFSTKTDILGLHTSKQLYEWSRDLPAGHRVELVSRLPASEGGGLSPEGGTIGNNRGGILESGYSSVLAGGDRIVWMSGSGGTAELFLTDMVKKETVRLDVPAAGAAGGAPGAMFEFGSSDGSVIYFRDSERLTSDASKSGDDLYECRVVEEGGSLGCVLSDLTPEADRERSEVQGVVLGGSSDGETVYFVANGVLAQGASQGSCKEKATFSGVCNLYVYRDGAIKFVASLGGEDEYDWGSDNEAYRSFNTLTARVSANGRFALFMSDRPLTGYDNRDAVSGERDQEVFLYDAQTEKLACVSCDPSGARPVGFRVSDASSLASVAIPRGTVFSSSSWIASNIPVGVSYGQFEGESLYQTRVLFDSGRVFFNSSDALVPGDVNGAEDVYEWEPVGVGSCSADASGLSESTGGCVSLISSGRGLGGAGLLDASASGDDVFFVSSDSLVRADVDSALDVYDAHVCGSGWACASEPAAPVACSNADSCRAASQPLPGVFGAPPSATFKGQGNAPATVKQTSRRHAKKLGRAAKLHRALAACRKKDHAHHRRARCEHAARRRYRAKRAKGAARAEGARRVGARRG